MTVPLADMTLTTAIWLIVLGAILIGMIITILVIRARLNVWKLFARRHGLDCHNDDGQPRVTGQIDGREFQLTIVVDSSDTGVLGLETLRMGLHLADVPKGLTVQRSSGMTGTAESTLDPDATTTGDLEFDRLFVVATNAAEEIHVLGDARRETLRRLAEEYPECDVLLHEGHLALQNRTAGVRRGMLEDWCAGLRSAASAWEEANA